MVKHFAFWIDIRFTKKTERGKKLLIFLLQNFMMYFWTFISRRAAHTVFDIFWKYKRTQKWLLSDWNLIQSWPSFLPRVASSRWLNKKTSQHGVCQHCPSLQLCCSARKLLVQVSWEKKKFLYNYIKPLKYSLPQSNYCPPLTNSKMELTINRS